MSFSRLARRVLLRHSGCASALYRTLMNSWPNAIKRSCRDMMAFGVAPAIYYALKFDHISVFPLFAATIYVGSAVYRISRFLVLTFQYYNFSFKGMPTNVAGCLAHVSILCFGIDHWVQPWIFCVLSALMVSAIPFEKPWFLRL